MSNRIEFFNQDTGDVFRTIIANPDDLETLGHHRDALLDAGVTGEISWRRALPPLVDDTLSQAEIKMECSMHILSHFSATAQRNVTLAHSLGNLAPAQQASLSAAMAWINQCREASQQYCSGPPMSINELQWPAPPEDLGPLVEDF